MNAYEWAHAAQTALKRGDVKSALEFLEAACMETSYLETLYCEAKFDEHDWTDQEPSIIMGKDWQKCSRCGCSRVVFEPPRLEVVK